MRCLVTGATGFIGRAILARLQDPVVLTRDVERAQPKLPGISLHSWNPTAQVPPRAAFQGIDTVLHLAGDPIAEGRWTSAKKQRMYDSRILGTQNLVRALEALPAGERPKVLVSASAVGYYGSRGDEVLDETSKPADDYLGRMCVDWEAAADRARQLGVRVAHPRIGVVLGRGGGALAKMLLPFKLGAGGRLADGRQWMPWVHLDDIASLWLWTAEHDISGPVNGTAPGVVTNAEFTQALAAALHRPAVFPVPKLALKVAFGELSDVLLASQRVEPRVAIQSGFQFRYPEIHGALAEIVG